MAEEFTTFGVILDGQSEESRLKFDIDKFDADPWGKPDKDWDSDRIKRNTINVEGFLNRAELNKTLKLQVRSSEKDLDVYNLLEKAESLHKKGRDKNIDKEGVLEKFQLNIMVESTRRSITFGAPKVKLSNPLKENGKNYFVFTIITKTKPIKDGGAL